MLSLHSVARPDKALWAVFALIGFTAVVVQTTLLRELIVVFQGNEASLGLMLAIWLLATACGAAIPVAMPSRRLVAVLQLAAALAFPAGIAIARASRLPFQSVPGETLGPMAMLAGAAATLVPFCLVSGGLFSAAARLRTVSSVYAAEAAGAAVGGLLASMVFVAHLDPFQIAAFAAALNIAAALYLFDTHPSFALPVVALLLAAPIADRATLAWLWRGFELLETRNSPYGNLAVTRSGSTLSLYENGLRMASVPDPQVAEESVHYALLAHPEPRSLLLIGGGINGAITQALLHPSLQRVDYVELDPAVIALAARHSLLPSDPRLHIHATDGRLFVQRSSGFYDVIIANLPEPQTAQLNRFYTVEFFREVRSRLTPGGVFSFALPASENYIGPQLAELLRVIRASLGAVFPNIALLPGDTVHFFASAAPLPLSPDLLLERLRARRLPTLYVSEYFLPFRMSPERVTSLASVIHPLPSTPLNRDFAPIACFDDNVRGYSLVAPRFAAVLDRLARVPLSWLFASLALALLIAVFTVRSAAGFAVASMGAVSMGLEVLLLLAFQALHGSLYHQLALVIAGFMAGMALAASFARHHTLRSLAIIQALGALAPLALFVALSAPVFFPLLALLCGALGGYQFAIAARVCNSGPALYALDLLGSAVAAVALGAWIIPVYGFFNTALLLTLINAVPAALIAWCARRIPAP